MKKLISLALITLLTMCILVGCGSTKELETENITITGELGSAKQIEINEIEVSAITDNLSDVITGFTNYDICIVDKKGNAVSPEGSVDITLTLSDELKAAKGNTYIVLYVDGNKVSKVDSSEGNGTIKFKTSHFSIYTVIKYDSEDKVANATFSNIPNDGMGEMAEINTIKHEHSYNDAVTKNATCTENGVKTFSCDCGDSYTEEVAMLEHCYVEVEGSAKEATCTEAGKEKDMQCSICGDTITGGEIPMTGHTFGSYVYNNDASYEADGTETATCSVCGATDTRTKSGTKLVKQEEPKEQTSSQTPSQQPSENQIGSWVLGEDNVWRMPSLVPKFLADYEGKTILEYKNDHDGQFICFSPPQGGVVLGYPDSYNDYIIGSHLIIYDWDGYNVELPF